MKQPARVLLCMIHPRPGSPRVPQGTRDTESDQMAPRHWRIRDMLVRRQQLSSEVCSFQNAGCDSNGKHQALLDDSPS